MKKNYDDLIVDTYKSIWIEDKDTGTYMRFQKNRYPLEWLAPIVKYLPILKHHVSMIGRREQGVDYYRYYEHYLKSQSPANSTEKSRQNAWQNRSEEVQKKLATQEVYVDGKSVLDISGEPGYLAKDLESKAKDVTVTAFADNVVKAIKKHLGIKTVEYDFQRHDLSKLFPRKKFDLVFSIYGIYFCTNLTKFFLELNKIMNKDGHFYVGFVEPSKGAMARWQFDDYTMLRLYTKDYVEKVAKENGFELVAQVSEETMHWCERTNLVHRLLGKFYLGRKFFGKDKKQEYQYITDLFFKKIK